MFNTSAKDNFELRPIRNTHPGILAETHVYPTTVTREEKVALQDEGAHRAIRNNPGKIHAQTQPQLQNEKPDSWSTQVLSVCENFSCLMKFHAWVKKYRALALLKVIILNISTNHDISS